MTATIVPADLSYPDKLALTPLHDVYATLLHDDGTIVAGDLGELVGSLIDDYDEAADADAALELRHTFALQSAGYRQALHAFVLNQEGDFDHEAESEETLSALFADRDIAELDVESWDHQVPLTLLATDYAPYTVAPAPQGNIQWLNPHTDLTLLRSMAVLGDFELFIREDSAGAAE